MKVLWFEFALSLRRLMRRRVQNGLLLVTMAVSVTLSLLSWSLFHTVHLSQPEFDPKGEYQVMSYAGATALAFRYHSSREEMEAYREGQQVFSVFEEMCFYDSSFIQTPGGTERFLGAFVSSGVLRLVGAKPMEGMGRLFSPADDVDGAAPVALLSQHMWENNFASDPDIVGKTMSVQGNLLTIVGVMPRSFRFPNDQDLWMSYGATPNSRYNPRRDALVKLKPGVSRERAINDMKVIQEGLGPESPANRFKRTPDLIPLRDFYLLPDVKLSAVILFALSLLFVAVSCVNAANLMLIDFLGRRSEVAAGLALGIPRGAAIRSVGIQVGLIALLAAVISIAILPVAGPLLYERVKFLNAPYWLVYQFQWRDVGMALALAAICAVMTVIAPMLYLLWVNPDRVIREYATTSRGTGRSIWRRVMLAGQIGILTVLSVTAGLLIHSSQNVGQSQWGYEAGRVFLAKMSCEPIKFPKEEEWRLNLKTLRTALDQMLARPETQAAALIGNPPGYSNGPFCAYALDPAGLTNSGTGLGEAYYSEVTEGYFDAMEVAFVAGETFRGDREVDGPHEVIMTESLAAKLWPGEDPLQRRLYAKFSWWKEGDAFEPIQVRGVVKDFQASGPTAKTNDALFFAFSKKWGTGTSIHFVVRDHAGVPSTRSLSDAIHRADPRMSLYFPSTIKGQIDLMLSSMRMTTDLTTVFAIAALLLGAIGVYSLTITQVLQSSREFGIRMALGAEPRQLWLSFAGSHLRTALLGVLLGLLGAWQLVSVLGSLLYKVDPHSVVTYAGVGLSILFVATLACLPSYFQLRRINPADCLRSL